MAVPRSPNSLPAVNASFALDIHAAYRCGRSGACCTAGWPIPVDLELRGRLADAVRAGVIRPASPPMPRPDALFEAAPGALDDEVLVRTDTAGACVFFQPGRPNLCAIHRDAGETLLPPSCRHFPRICLIDARGVFVTLSHYCPTAAGALFSAARGLDIVSNPVAFPPGRGYEGLDARAELPPLVRPGVLAGWDGYGAWEAQVVSTLATKDLDAEDALRLAAAATETVRAWTPADGPVPALVDRAFAGARAAGPTRSTPVGNCLSAARALYREVRGSVPAPIRPPAEPLDLAAAHQRFVAAPWPAFAAPVRRYLAAHAFANWCAYQGRGLRTVVRSVVAAYAVLRVEAARQSARAGRELDERMLLEAFRQADLLLRHLASREDLAQRLSTAEAASPAALLDAIG